MRYFLNCVKFVKIKDIAPTTKIPFRKFSRKKSELLYRILSTRVKVSYYLTFYIDIMVGVMFFCNLHRFVLFHFCRKWCAHHFRGHSDTLVLYSIFQGFSHKLPFRLAQIG